VVTDGFRRNRALQFLLNEQGVDIARVPFMLEPKGYSDKDRLFDMFIKNDGKRLTPLEEGYLFVRLENMGYERKEISQKVGRTEAHISNMIQLAQADPQIQKFIKDGKVSSTEVTKLLKDIKDPNQQKTVLTKAVEEAAKDGKGKATAKAIAKATEKTGADSKKAGKEAAKAADAKPAAKAKPDKLGATLTELVNDIPVTMKTPRVETLREVVKFASGEIRLDQLLDFFMAE
jgi:ParB-like chromosome segregation protein Spo0J